MSIQKKSLISTLKATKKANVASAPLAQVESEGTTDKKLAMRHSKVFSKRHSKVMVKAYSKR
jgi:hypothetical protein